MASNKLLRRLLHSNDATFGSCLSAVLKQASSCADANFAISMLPRIAPHENYLQTILGSPYPVTDQVLSACRGFHWELGECLQRAVEWRREIEEASGSRKKDLRNTGHVFSEHCWGRFADVYQSTVPHTYFRMLAPLVNILMKTLKDRRQL